MIYFLSLTFLISLLLIIACTIWVIASRSVTPVFLLFLSIIIMVVSFSILADKRDSASFIYTTTTFEEIYKAENNTYYIKSGNDLYEVTTSDIGIGNDNLLIKQSKPEFNIEKYSIIVKDMSQIKDFNEIK